MRQTIDRFGCLAHDAWRLESHPMNREDVKNRSYYHPLIARKGAVIGNPVIPHEGVVDNKDKKKRVVAAGRLSEEKNFRLLIEAFNRANIHGYTLHIYGRGEKESELRRLIAKHELIERVFLEGHVDDISEILS